MLDFLRKSPINFLIAKFSGDPIFTSIYVTIIASLILEAVIIFPKKKDFDHKKARLIGYPIIVFLLILSNIAMYLVRS
ncbi:MAG: hypothetical protein M1371_08905 [Actinobacteria bacterium]|nr:hypothetical protein [Actinomycetota bacterium]